jgi:hypothetical protein
MWEKVPIIKGLAETERFELSVQMYPYDGLANRWFQPLTHVSGSQRRRGPIAGGLGWGKGLGVSFFPGSSSPIQSSGATVGRRTDSPYRRWIA